MKNPFQSPFYQGSEDALFKKAISELFAKRVEKAVADTIVFMTLELRPDLNPLSVLADFHKRAEELVSMDWI